MKKVMSLLTIMPFAITACGGGGASKPSTNNPGTNNPDTNNPGTDGQVTDPTKSCKDIKILTDTTLTEHKEYVIDNAKTIDSIAKDKITKLSAEFVDINGNTQTKSYADDSENFQYKIINNSDKTRIEYSYKCGGGSIVNPTWYNYDVIHNDPANPLWKRPFDNRNPVKITLIDVAASDSSIALSDANKTKILNEIKYVSEKALSNKIQFDIEYISLGKVSKTVQEVFDLTWSTYSSDVSSSLGTSASAKTLKTTSNTSDPSYIDTEVYGDAYYYPQALMNIGLMEKATAAQIEKLNSADIVFNFARDKVNTGLAGASAGGYKSGSDAFKAWANTKNLKIESYIETGFRESIWSTTVPALDNKTRFSGIAAHEVIHAMGIGTHSNGWYKDETTAGEAKMKQYILDPRGTSFNESSIEYGDLFSIMGTQTNQFYLAAAHREDLGISKTNKILKTGSSVTLSGDEYLKAPLGYYDKDHLKVTETLYIEKQNNKYYLRLSRFAVNSTDFDIHGNRSSFLLDADKNFSTGCETIDGENVCSVTAMADGGTFEIGGYDASGNLIKYRITRNGSTFSMATV